MESDATIENEKLKKEIEDLKKDYEAKIKQLEIKNEALESDCHALTNRCWVSSSMVAGGTMCYFCELRGYICKHTVSFEDKIKFAKERMKMDD